MSHWTYLDDDTPDSKHAAQDEFWTQTIDTCRLGSVRRVRQGLRTTTPMQRETTERKATRSRES